MIGDRESRWAVGPVAQHEEVVWVVEPSVSCVRNSFTTYGNEVSTFREALCIMSNYNLASLDSR